MRLDFEWLTMTTRAAKRRATEAKFLECPICSSNISADRLKSHIDVDHPDYQRVAMKPASEVVLLDVPEGAVPGTELMVTMPSGQQITLTVPEGAVAGQQLEVQVAVASEEAEAQLITKDRPEDRPEIAKRVEDASTARTGDHRYSVMPNVVPAEKILQLSRDFFTTTELLEKDGNTFGEEFEQQYTGHLNYFYYMNRNLVVPGAEKAAYIFEELDHYTRQVVEAHHPGMCVRLERAFGAYYEGKREHFHLGVSEHCDGDGSLVSTIVHAVLPDGDCGFTSGGELTISASDDSPAVPIAHSNETVGSVVYLGPSVFHKASPINAGGKRMVFCMFYACSGDTEFPRHALA